MAALCLPCAMNHDPDAPQRENVLRTPNWRVAHAFDARLPGWLVIVAGRHVSSVAELDAAAAEELGRLQWALSLALREVVACEKTYVMQFSEADGFAHLHFHLVPRMPALDESLRGPRIFAMLGAAPDQQVPTAEMDRLALQLGNVATTYL